MMKWRMNAAWQTVQQDEMTNKAVRDYRHTHTHNQLVEKMDAILHYNIARKTARNFNGNFE